MSTPTWLADALRRTDINAGQKVVLIELKRRAAAGEGEGNVRDIAETLGMSRQTVFDGILRLQHLAAIDLVLRDSQPATAWFDFGATERAPDLSSDNGDSQ